MEFEIGGAIDSAHSAATEFAVEAIALAQHCARCGKRSRPQLIREDLRLLGIGPIIGHMSFAIYHLSFSAK